MEEIEKVICRCCGYLIHFAEDGKTGVCKECGNDCWVEGSRPSGWEAASTTDQC